MAAILSKTIRIQDEKSLDFKWLLDKLKSKLSLLTIPLYFRYFVPIINFGIFSEIWAASCTKKSAKKFF